MKNSIFKNTDYQIGATLIIPIRAKSGGII